MNRRTLLVALLGSAFLTPLATAGFADDQKPQRGGTLTSVETNWSISLQPHVLGGYPYVNLYGIISDSLLYYDYERGLVPWLAESYEVNEAFSEFTFRLRPGVTFSDGSPVDAAAVKANFDDLGFGAIDKGVNPSAYFKGYVKTDVLDDLTVRVTFETTNSRFLTVVSTQQAAIVAPATLALNSESRSQLQNVIGSGAFTVESYKTNEEVVLKRRDGYAWPPASSPNPGEAYLDRVILKFSADPSVRTSALLSNQADLVRSVLPSDEDRLKAAGNEVRRVSGSKTLYAWTLNFRLVNPLLQDPKVRQAIADGFDRKAITAALLSPSYIAADSLVGRDHEAFVDQSEALAYNPEKAEALLEEAGWTLNSSGVREKDGKELRLSLAAHSINSFAKEFSDAIAQQLSQIGIIVENRAGDNAFATQVINPTGQSDVGLIIGQGWFQNGFEGYLTGYFTGLPDEGFVEILRQEREAADPQQRVELLKREQQYFVSEQWLGVPLLEEGQIYGIGPKVRGLTFSAAIVPQLQSAWVSAR